MSIIPFFQNSMPIGLKMTTIRSCLRRMLTVCSHIHRAPTLQQAQTLTLAIQGVRPSSIRAISTSWCRLSEQQSEISNNFHIQDEDDFQKRVIDSKTPTVVDFHADWCGPCKQLGPKLEKAIDEHEGKVFLAKVDIDDLSDIAMKYNVKVVPTVVGIKNGEAIRKFEGNMPENDIKAFVNKLISS